MGKTDQQEELVQLLRQSMSKAANVASGLEEVHIGLEKIGNRLPTLRARFAPIEWASEQVDKADSQKDVALKSAACVLKRFEQLKQLKDKILLGDPHQDIGSYLVAVQTLDETLTYLRTNCPGTLQCLHRAFHSYAAATKTTFDKKNENLGDDLAAGSQIMDVALDKLQMEFGRLLLDNACPIDMAKLTKEHEEQQRKRARKKKKKKRKEHEYMPVRVSTVQKLQMIAKGVCAISPPVLQKCIQMYEEQRIKTINNLQHLCNSVEEWSATFQVLVEVLYMGEMNLCCKVFGEVMEEELWSECVARVGMPGMSSLLDFGEGQVASCKSVDKLFNLLDMFESLQNVSSLVSELLFRGQGPCCSRIRIRTRELHKLVVDGAAKSFSNFKYMIAHPNHSPPQDAGVDKLSSYVVEYLKHIMSEFYSPIMEQVLRIEASWRRQKVSSKSLLESSFKEIMSSLETALDAQSKQYKEPVQQRIFLMNNAYFVFKRMRSMQQLLIDGDPWLRERRMRVQQHGLSYQKQVWGNVLVQVSRQQGLFLGLSAADASRQLVKQRLDNFATVLEETCRRHRGCVIPDAELCDATRSAIVHDVIPAYRSYLQSYAPLIDPSPARLSAHNVETVLADLFHSLTPNAAVKN